MSSAYFFFLSFSQNLRNEEQVAIIQASTVLSLAEKVINYTDFQIISVPGLTPKEQGRVIEYLIKILFFRVKLPR